jgi:hypothetical protein
MFNLEVLEGAVIALISATGGALLQEFLVRRADQRQRQTQFALDTLLKLQAAIGDLAIAAEQIESRKQSSGSWQTGEYGLLWRSLNKQRVQTIRYSVLVADPALQQLSSDLEQAYYDAASATSTAEATHSLVRARELLRETNILIGKHFRQD